MHSFLPYWGKAKPESGDNDYHPLVYHSLDVAAVGVVLLKRIPLLRKTFAQAFGLGHTRKDRALEGLLGFLLSIHDVGKHAITFQILAPDLYHRLHGPDLPPFQSYQRHDVLGARLLQDELGRDLARLPHLGANLPDDTNLANILKPLLVAVTCHHGQPVRPPGKIRIKKHFKGTIEAARDFLHVMDAIHQPVLPKNLHTKETRKNLDYYSHLLAGFTVLCDWLGSNQYYFEYTQPTLSPAAYWKLALKNACRAVKETLIAPPKAAPKRQWRELFPAILSPTALQIYADKVPLGPAMLYIIEDLTGSGKTEAALLLAHRLMAAGHAHGLYFALPTMATADQMFDRLAHSYSLLYKDDPQRPASISLAHGQRHASPGFRNALGLEQPPGERDYGDQCEAASAVCSPWLADSGKKALLANIGVGTIDQAMLAVLPAHHGMLRLYGLVGKVLILDEIHAYDQRMNAIIQKLITFHTALGGSTILLSATLPQAVRNDFIKAWQTGAGVSCDVNSKAPDPYPLFTQVSKDSSEGCAQHLEPPRSRALHLDLVTLTSPKVLDPVIGRIKDLLDAGDCVCWIRNTVADAVDAYEKLIRIVDPGRVTLFHARFLMGDRLKIQEDVLETFGRSGHGSRRRGKVVVATQVVEQSLNVDFDHLITDLAPVDLLLQRAGRQRRHPRDPEGNLIKDDSDKAWSQDPRTNRITVLTPPWEPEPAVDWYASVFPRANRVYRNTTYLWLTHQALRAKVGAEQAIQLPGDVRELIEGVYSPEKTAVPAGLQTNFEAMRTEAEAMLAKGKQVCLSLEAGYDQPGIYESEKRIQTRTGLDSVTVRLAEWDGEGFQPLTLGERAWENSQVSVGRHLIAQAPKLPADQRRALTRLNYKIHDRNRFVTFIPVTRDGGQFWRGVACKEDGKEVQFRYSRTRGLEVR